MEEQVPRRLVGGPWAGQTVTLRRDVSVLTLEGYADHAYYKTRDYSVRSNPDWWMMGLPEPQPLERFFEWHERGWVDPMVQLIRDTIREAADRLG